jgi:hypothetical protein
MAGVNSQPGIVRANSFTLPKRQNRISRPLIFLHFSGRSERFDGRSKYLEFCSDNALCEEDGHRMSLRRCHEPISTPAHRAFS